jgi:prepilin-type N-terminal cleavage/methylation domain-containing protein
MDRDQRYITGFTLIELSIVLVIIGLIIAGVVAGQTLVEQARFSRVISDVNNYKTAVNTFRVKYNAFPGDLRNADEYWAAATAGNGDNRLLTQIEARSAWHHLSLSEVISFSHSGATDADTIGLTVPPSPLTNSGYRFTDSATALYNTFGNRITLESPDTNVAGTLGFGVLTATDAQSIDEKMDDGAADAGIVYATTPEGTAGGATECTTGQWDGTDTTSSYNLNIADQLCRVIFWYNKI